MSNKKKFVIAISIISIMILCLSISSFAANYPYGIELHDGDIIVFKDIVNVSLNENIDININFNVNGSTWNYISIRNYNTTQASRTNDIRYYYGEYQGQMVFNGANDSWYDSSYKTIIIRGNQTIIDENSINWLYKNTVSGLPEPPHLEPSFWETVSGFFSEALASGTAIVNWMTITPIALIPLALYCLIVIIAITKRMIKG